MCQHEKLDGTGHPFGYKVDNLSVPAQILAVCDIFQAIVQDRPYRPGMDKEQAIAILDKESKSGKINIDVVNIIKNDMDYFYQQAS